MTGHLRGAAGGTRGGPAAWVAWGAWAGLAVVGAFFIARFSADMPLWDEAIYVPVLADEEPASIEFLWRQHTDHRIPLPKAVYLLVAGAAGGDFRAPAFFNLAAMAVASALVLSTLRRLRGSASVTDAIVPLSALHLGQSGAFLWGFQVQFTLSVLLLAAWTWGTIGGAPSRGRAVVRSFALVLLPLCGGNGIATALPLATWHLFAAAAARRDPDRRREATLLAAPAQIALALAGAILLSLDGTLARGVDAGRIPAVALQFLGGALGPAGSLGWDGSSLAPWLLPLGAIAVAAAVAACALLLVRTDAPSRPEAFALLACLAAQILLGLSVAYARSSHGPLAGLHLRYVPLATPLAWFLVLAWERAAPPGLRVPGLRVALAGGLLLAAYGTRVGILQGMNRAGRCREISTMLRLGWPPRGIAEHHAATIGIPPAEFEEQVRLLRAARLGPFREDR